MRRVILVTIGILLVACVDKAQPEYDRCKTLAARDHEGDLQDAVAACNSAVAADPSSTSGKAAAAKLTELQPKLDAWKKHEADRQAENVLAEAKAQAAQAEADAKCPEWMTICDIGPNGSGVNTFQSKVKCERMVDNVRTELGAKCDPCRCWK